MNHAYDIWFAVCDVADGDNSSIFSRDDVRSHLGIAPRIWHASYSPIFQGMRADHPGGAPKVKLAVRKVFLRVGYGKYKMSYHGRELFGSHLHGTPLPPDIFDPPDAITMEKMQKDDVIIVADQITPGVIICVVRTGPQSVVFKALSCEERRGFIAPMYLVHADNQPDGIRFERIQ